MKKTFLSFVLALSVCTPTLAMLHDTNFPVIRRGAADAADTTPLNQNACQQACFLEGLSCANGKDSEPEIQQCEVEAKTCQAQCDSES